MSELLEQFNQAVAQLRAQEERLASLAQEAVAQSEHDANRCSEVVAALDTANETIRTLLEYKDRYEAAEAEIKLMRADREYSPDD